MPLSKYPMVQGHALVLLNVLLVFESSQLKQWVVFTEHS